MRIFCIADEDTVRGLRLARVQGRAVTGAAEANAALDEALAQNDCGIVVMTEKVAADLSERVASLRQTGNWPLFASIPGPDGPMTSGMSLLSLVEQSVGVSLNERKEHNRD
mgnify:CR=1 FL=1